MCQGISETGQGRIISAKVKLSLENRNQAHTGMDNKYGVINS